MITTHTAPNQDGWKLKRTVITCLPYPLISLTFQSLALPATGASTQLRIGYACPAKLCFVAVL